jgi:predicted RNA-binding Zn-ribbon protein involved in translation (DUF1610 family)
LNFSLRFRDVWKCSFCKKWIFNIEVRGVEFCPYCGRVREREEETRNFDLEDSNETQYEPLEN